MDSFFKGGGTRITLLSIPETFYSPYLSFALCPLSHKLYIYGIKRSIRSFLLLA